MNTHAAIFASLVVLSASTAAIEARADENAGANASAEKAHFVFGKPGTLVLTGAAYVGGSSSSYAHSDASRASFGVNPAFDWFLDKNVSLGLSLPIGYVVQKGYGADGSSTRFSQTSYSIGARLGYNAPIGERFSVYFNFTFGGGYRSYEETQLAPASGKSATTESNTYSDSGFWGSIYVPLLFHATPHFFVGFGPSIYHDLTRARGNPEDKRPDNLETTIGASLVLGGSF